MSSTTLWSRHGIGKRFENAELSKVNKKYFSDVFEYAEQIRTHIPEGRGLLLSGPPGIGKTYAMCALMKHLKEHFPRFDFQLMTAPGMFDLLDKRDIEDPWRKKSWWATMETVRGLVINDLGKEDRSRPWLTESVTAKLGRVLRARHEEQLPIFITTNLPLVKAEKASMSPTFASTYGDAIWSLIYDMTIFRSEINAPDLRRGEPDEE